MNTLIAIILFLVGYGLIENNHEFFGFVVFAAGVFALSKAKATDMGVLFGIGVVGMVVTFLVTGIKLLVA